MNAESYWQTLKEGDRTSLEWLYRSFADQLIRYGYAFTKEDALVEDCVQELFITLWEKRNSLGETTSVKNYLFASLRRNIWHKQRKEKKGKEKDLDQNYQFDVELNIEEQKINDEETAEKTRKLKEAMNDLSSRQKELLYLKYEAGLSYEDICTMMDINYQSARNLLSGALRNLRKQLSTGWGLFFLWM